MKKNDSMINNKHIAIAILAGARVRKNKLGEHVSYSSEYKIEISNYTIKWYVGHQRRSIILVAGQRRSIILVAGKRIRF
jgi:hypothetical protein